MPVLFDDTGTDQWLALAFASGNRLPIAAPFAMGAWVYNDDVTVNPSTIMAISDTGSTNNYWQLRFSGTTLTFALVDGADSTVYNHGTTISANTWYHVCAIENASNSRTLLLDGVAAAANTDDRTPDGADTITIGALEISSGDFHHFSGRSFWPFVYNDAISVNDVLMLAKGAYSPTIRRDALVNFPRLLFDENRDIISGAALTQNGSPTVNNDRPFQTQFVSGRARNRSRVRMSA